jgi:hypothetical protein
MNILQLPPEIIYIVINDMLSDAIPLQTVSKYMKELSKEKLKENHDKYLRKQDFYERGQLTPGNRILFYQMAYYKINTLEECDFLYEKWVKKYDRESFFKKVKYVIETSFQIQAETWTKYIYIHKK